MFGHDHRGEDVAIRIDHLMAAVFEVDDRARREPFSRHVAPDVVYVTPEALYEGVEGLSEAFAPYPAERIGVRPACAARARSTCTTATSASPGLGQSSCRVHGGLRFRRSGRGCGDGPGGDVRGIGPAGTRRRIMTALKT